MAKRLNINLAFTADASQAKSAIMDLQSSLSKIANMNTGTPGVDPNKLKAASSAAKELSIHLNNAFNAQTGNFDLSKLDRSLKTSQTNITQLANKLLSVGAAGEQAFVKLAQTISMADRPVVTLNSKLSEMLTTLKNTARWQISSSILHGFMGTVQQAYGYAQDLNQSLNEIRIVSGQNTEQMAQFADEANKAAKNLSTTTTAYTRAALIFYQQGDKGSTITEKSDVVTKMANVTGQSTSVVSDQLTAIWNNFNKSGDEAYEHYADVLTALGAATASSTDEIAGGLEKFAGIAETVGLSYEYAAAALATITATSRESEDVVGTALKTIFSRIQGLSLGETLEDGTDLNKYSEALATVGISIKDQTGEIRKMDDILDDMGAKWRTLSNDQQMALAQTVAGVRQYNQLMTLMNSWDFMQKNVETARNSDGALQKQHETYEEGWKAANKRVRASMEAVYTDLINDQFFIDIANGFSALIDSVDAFIDGIGGVKTVLMSIGSIFLSSVANKIQPALDNLKHSFSVVFQTAEQQAKGLANQMNESITKTLSSDTGKMFSFSSKVALENARDLNIARSQLQAIEPKLNALEKQRYTQELAMIEAQQQETQAVADRITVLQKEKEAILDKIETESLTRSGQAAYTEGSREMRGYVSRAKSDFDAADESELANATKVYFEARQAADQYNAVQKDVIETTSQLDGVFRQIGDSLDLSQPGQNLDILNDKIKELYGGNFSTIKQNFEALNSSVNGINPAGMESIRQQIQLTVASMPKAIRESQQMKDALDLALTASPEDMVTAFEILDDVLKDLKIDTKDFGNVLKEINPERYKALKENAEAAKKATEQLGEMQKKVNKSINDFKPKHTSSAIEQYTQLASTLGKVAMAATSVRSIFQAWGNEDLSFGEKIITSFMSISMLVPSVVSAFSGLKNVLLSTAAGERLLAEASALSIEMMVSESVALTAKELAYDKHKLAMIANKMVTEQLTGAELANLIQTELGCTAKQAETVAETLNKNMREQNTSSILIQTIAIKLQDFADQAHTKTIWAKAAAWMAAKLAAGELLVVTLALTAAIAGIALVGVGLVKFVDQLVVTQEEANEAINTATENYTKEIDKLKELEGELSSINDQIDELNSKDSLSIVEQSELADLERRKALLEAQVALQEKLAKDAQREQAEEISKNWDKAKSSGETEEIRSFVLENGNLVEQTVEEYAKDMGYNIATGEFSKDSVTPPEKQEITELYIKEWMEGNETYRRQWQEDNAEQYGKDEANYAAIIAAAQSGAYDLSDEEKTKMQKDLETSRKAMHGEDYNDTFIKPLLSHLDSMQVTKRNGNYEVNANASQDILDARGLSQEQLNQYLSEVINANKGSMDKLNSIEGFDFNKLNGDQLFTLIDNLDQISNFDGSSIEDLITSINGIEEIEPPQFNLSEWKSNYSKISEIIKDLETGDSISAEEYAALGDEYKSYFALQYDGTATLIGKTSELKDLVHSIEMGGLEDNVKKTQDVNNLMTTENARHALAVHDAGANYRDPALNAYMEMVNSTYEQSFTDYEEAISFMEQQNSLLEEEQNLRALNSQSLGELNDLLAQGLITAEQYNNATETVFTNEAKAEGFDLEEIYAYTDALISSEQFLEENREEAQRFALAQFKMERGFDALVSDYEDWNEVMSDSKATLRDVSRIMPGVNKALQDMLDLSDEQFALLPDNFAKDNWKLIQDVYNQVDGAYEALRAKVTEEIIMNIGLDNESMNATQAAVNEFLANVELDDIEIGTTLDQTGFADGLQALLDSGHTTVQQMNKILEGIGYEPNIEYEKVALSSFDRSTQQGYVQTVGVDGTVEYVPITADMDIQGEQYVYVPKIGSSKFKGGGSGAAKAKARDGSGGGKKGGGGGGGGSKPKPTSEARKKKGDVVDRYKEINDKLEETSRLLKKNNVEADSLWGPKRIAALKNGVKLLEQENKQLKEKYELSKAYLEEDADALHQAAVDAGISFTIDNASGAILNYTDAMTLLFNERERLLNSFGSTMTESEEERLTALDDKIEKVKEAYEQYEKTLDEKQDLEQEQIEKVAEIQQQYYDILSEELEIKMTVNDNDLKLLEYHLGKIEDDFYNMAEAAALMIDSSNSLGMSQMDIYSNSLANYSEHLKRLEEDYAAGKISQASYIEGLQETQDGIISNLEALNDLDDAMIEYYGDTLDMAIEEIAKYTDQMDHLVGVLDHYQSLMEIMGKENNYAAMGVVLEGRAKLLEDQVAASKSTMEMLKSEVADRYQAYQDALESGNEAAAEIYLKQYEDALAAANEAEDEFLSKAEEWAESLKAILENKLKGLNKTLEEALTGGTTFDSLNTAMERAKSLQEEYLTTTNKIYETNKLMRKAQQEIDKTTNSVAKKRLQEFITETDQLQDKAKLSKYELDIQQAKYDLLLAEIALQEAQNAKSTVRLQRDSEGNFGYVYTADENLVAEAEQTLLDKQNELYNLSLDGANEYKEKYLQTLNEMYDTLADLQQQKMDGMFASEEEYQQAVAEATQFYYEQLEQYADLHGIAIVTDGRVINEAWSADFAGMVQDTAVWKVAVDGYLAGAEEAFGQWVDGIGKVAEAVGIPLDQIGNDVNEVTGSFSKLKGEVNRVTNESTQLKNALIGKGGVIETVQSEITAVKSATEKYASLREELGRVKKSYEDLIATINATIKAQANLNNSSASNSSKGSSGTTSSSGKGNTNQGGSNTGSSGSNKGNNNPSNPGPGSSGTKVTINVSKNPYVDGSAGTMTFKNKVDRYWNNKGTQLPYSFKLNGQEYYISASSHKKLADVGFDTGGYTGQWGPSGKWAMLHEKELVLNKKDTENFLASMDILDKIVSVIDLHSANAQLGGLLSTPRYSGFKDNQVLEQNVRIEASFPNATNHSEIEEAFNNLINTASQYANRK